MVMSSRKSEQSQAGYILHTRPYRETSMLVEVFSRDAGRVGLIAKGVRKSRKQNASLLQPFRPLLISWTGKGELPILTGVEQIESVPGLPGRAVLSGFYINELLLRLLHRHDPHPDLFDLYRQTLDNIHSDTSTEYTLRIFEKGLLNEIGYGVPLETEANSGEPVRSEAMYTYVVEHGPVNTDMNSDNTAMRYHGSSLLALNNNTLDDPVSLRESKILLRNILSDYLGDKPLNTRSLYMQLEQMTKVP